MGEKDVSKEADPQKEVAVKICRVTLNVSDPDRDYISSVKLRGFLGSLFVDDAEFHHHSERSYHYPLIQYKRVTGELMILGLQDYAKVLMNKMSIVDSISTKHGSFKVDSQEMNLSTWQIRNISCCYDFATPWLPLNEANYSAFKNCTPEKQKAFLEKMLVGNTLSCLKGLGIFVDYRVESFLVSFRSFYVRAHGNPFEAFTARFFLNVDLPDFIGLGKSVSKGFGTIRRAV
ncbi:MAG: CRISPR-associated endonuclease Cas6 [Candidatus Bathyarchaeota archaeon]|nr:CRISPR-associated endonuclease Cas6 [Candidatus Bathyarchaeota archaeon]